MIARAVLQRLYLRDKLSVRAIAKRLACSEHKVNYWLSKHSISKRSISEAIYQKWNPHGDPFRVRRPRTVSEGVLYGLGVGLYWGEGTKANKNSVRLGNSDPRLIRRFIDFLEVFYQIERSRLRFGLHVFGDLDLAAAKRCWMRRLGISGKQFYPTAFLIPHRGIGSYRKKSKYGVLTLYFNNKKLRDTICGAVDKIAEE